MWESGTDQYLLVGKVGVTAAGLTWESGTDQCLLVGKVGVGIKYNVGVRD